MNTYNTFQPQVQQGLSDYAKNPLESTFFNQRYGAALKQTRMAGQRDMQNILQRASLGSNGANPAGFQQALLASQSRANSGAESNAFLQNLFAADDQRRWALSSMQGYNPLQTGQNTVEKTSGLGTWLPQVIGAGVAGAGAFFSGGATLAAKGASMGARLGSAALAAGGSMIGGFGRGSGGYGGGGYYPQQQWPGGTPPYLPFGYGYGSPQSRSYVAPNYGYNPYTQGRT